MQDPHNLGACLRTADACGALAVIVPKDRAAQLTPAVRKVAAGAAETTPRGDRDQSRAHAEAAEGGAVCGSSAPTPRRDQAAAEVDFTGGTVLVLGAEGAGLRQLTRQNCDHMVRLPQLGPSRA